MFEVVLFNPEIAPNTGNVIRLCANTGCALHLVRPLGFELDDRQLRRAGLDYHEYASVKTYGDWHELAAAMRSRRLFAFSTRASKSYDRQEFKEGDVLVFGRETGGLSAEVLTDIPPSQRLRLPMAPNNRSLNLSNAVAVVVYEAWRQNGFRGGS